jgi:uncharacterized protein (DUF302 family)
MSELATNYSLEAISPYPFDGTLRRVRGELANEGFGVLCEIDVQKTMHEKLGVELPPYVILGACNPQLAHRALEIEPQLGVFLPCNVIVYERDEGVRVAAIDPKALLAAVGNPGLATIVAELRDRLERVVRRAARA